MSLPLILLGFPAQLVLWWLFGVSLASTLPVVAGMAAWVGVGWLHTFSSCPQCGNLFYQKLIRFNPLRKTCIHCGLSLPSQRSAV